MNFLTLGEGRFNDRKEAPSTNRFWSSEVSNTIERGQQRSAKGQKTDSTYGVCG